MKNKALKVLASLCSIVLLLTCFAIPGFAKAEYEWSTTPAGAKQPVISNYTWYALGKATKVEENLQYFVISTTAGEYAEKLYVSFPNEGGFRVQSQHEFYESGIQESHVGLFEPSGIATIDYKKDSSGAVIMTGADGTVVRYKQSSTGFELEVCNSNGKKLLGITNAQISFAYSIKNTVVRTMVELPLTEKEGIYQGGERYNSANQVGKYTSLANVDAWSAPDMAYINVPIFHSNRGYSIWFNNSYPGTADIGWSNPNKYALTFDGSRLDFFLWTGTPLENLKKYTDLTGTSGMYNEWTFGFWTGAMSSAFNNTRKQNAYANMIDLLEGYAENYNFYPESMYGEGQNSQYSQNIQYQAERGIRTTYWFYPASESTTMVDYLPGMPSRPQFDENGNMISTGYPYNYVTTPLEQSGIYTFQQQRWYDYSNPSTIQVTTSRMLQLWKWGVSGAMIDYGEYLTYTGTAFNGVSSMEMHNFNSYYYAKHSSEAWQDFWKGDYVLYERSGAAGSQYFVGNFLGDQRTTWVGYQAQIHSMISMGASGYNLYGGDLGGLGGKATDDLLSRWIVLSCFSPWNRQHGANIHMPWEQGDANRQNFGQYYYFRKNIVPTVMNAAMDANKTSNPIIKGMMMAYPYQLGLVDVSNQYLFCDDFLVCAVTEEQQYTLDVYLPNGDTWYNLFTYDRLEGGQKITVEAPTAFMPIYVKDGAVKAINLPDSMILADEMHDDVDVDSDLGMSMGYGDEHRPHASLLITPPDEERTTTIHVMDGDVEDFRTYDSHTEVYTSKPVSNSTFTLTNKQGSDRTTILALGVTASEISYDGEVLPRLDHMPDYFQEEYGYYVELSGLTTIYLPAGWKEITIVKGDAAYEPYEMEGIVGGSDRMFDGDVTTSFMIPTASTRPTEMMFSYDEPVAIGRVVAKWAVGYLTSYDIEYSVDGEEWFFLSEYVDDEHTITDGAGSFDVFNVPKGEEVYASYLRITPANNSRPVGITISPAIYELEVYPPDTFDPLAEDEEDLPEYDEEEDYFEEDEYYEEETPDETIPEDDDDDDDGDEDDQNAGGKGKRKKIIRRNMGGWLIILIIGGGVILLTGILLLILLLLKKKKKQAEEAVEDAEAAEESPVDFPGAEE